jgi:hypothetical protein
MRGNKPHVDRTKKDSQRAAPLAKGGTTRMFGAQAAGSARPGHTGKDQRAAPWPPYARGDENVRRGETVRGGESANFARGGQLKSKPRGARPAKPGASSQR